jgi:hypothetical protein
MRRIPGVLVSLMAILVFGMAVSAGGTSQAASPNFTIVTIPPDTPDDFLNLYPDFDDNELAQLPLSGVSSGSFIYFGIVALGVLAVALAVSLMMIRTQRRASID